MSVAIPVIELGSLLATAQISGDKSSPVKAAEQLTNAFEEYGLCYIRLDDVENGYATRIGHAAIAAAKQLFDLPPHIKNAVACDHRTSGVTRGYLNVGCESGGECFERKEAFSYGYDWEGTKNAPSNSLEAENVWPNGADNTCRIRRLLDEHYRHAGEIMQAVVKALSMTWVGAEVEVVALQRKHDNWLADMIRNGDTISLMRCFHYFSQRSTAVKETGSVAHTDWGFATLITQQINSEMALQVYYDGHWVDIPPIANTFVVNCGDFASLLSRGRLRSPLHRVVLTNSERLSLVYFQYPAFDTKVPAPVPGTSTLSLLQDQSENKQSRKSAALEQDDDICFGQCIAWKWKEVRRTRE